VPRQISVTTVLTCQNGACEVTAPFRLGLIGAGRMGRTHMRALADSKEVAITAIAEPSPQSRSTLSGDGFSVHTSFAEMIANAQLDAVLVAVPSDQHLSIISELASSGLPILCEKPCGLTSQQALRAAEIAAAGGVRLQVAYWRRYVPALTALRDRIRGGELGVLHLVACYQWDEVPPSAQFRAHSGGIAIDMGVHEFDQIRWLTGQDIGEISAVAVPASADAGVTGDVDSAQVLTELSGGAAGFVSLGRYHPPGDMARAEVFGTGGFERCDFLDPADGERAQLGALRRQAEEFARYARGADCSGATAADAVAALRAAEQVIAAIPAISGSGLPE
jgi:myo-inositol 2-dehydrogenase / D-chiro-inositol 1-dehydrogenase